MRITTVFKHKFSAVKDFSIVHPLAPVGRAIQDLKQGVPTAVETAATLLMAPVGLSASTDFKVRVTRSNLKPDVNTSARSTAQW